MGEEVARLHRRTAVVDVSPDPDFHSARPQDLGRWLERERRLRDISVEFVAARLRLEPARLQALESGREVLATDGRGRSTARALARAIGADPEAAAAFLLCERRRTPPRRTRRIFTGASLGGALAGAALLSGLGLAALWARDAHEPRPPPTGAVLHRPDYVGRLLSEAGASPVEPVPEVGEAQSRP